MKRSSLRDLVRAHYGSASLPRATVTAWLAAARSDAAVSPPVGSRPLRRRWALIALGAASIAALLWIGWRAWLPSQSTLVREIAVEVAANHAKARPLDVEATSYSQLRRSMDRFEFTLVEPQHPSCAGLELVGARYCSIQGRPAAQIRLRDPRGESFTLYETRDDAAFGGLADSELVVDGSIVRIWRGDGLLFALATAAH